MAKTNENYYDFDIDVETELVENGLIDQLFYLRDLQQRKLYLNGDIDAYTVADAVRHILQFNREDAGIPVGERKPIILYLTSNGGSVDAGFGLIDAIRTSKTPVWTVNLSFWYSMGFLIGLAGHCRFAMPNAKCLMHDGSNFVYNSGAKAQDQMEFQKKGEGRVREYILSRSKLTAEEYDSKLRVEWYLFASEAKEKGFIDFVIGADVDVDEIV